MRCPMNNRTVYERDIVDITVEEILAMEAGPELDYLVALHMPESSRQYEIIRGEAGGNVYFEHWDTWARIFKPSRDANDALVVWRALPQRDSGGRDLGSDHRIGRGTGGDESIEAMLFGEDGHVSDLIGVYDDFCPAVCKAYLWTVKRGWGMVMATLKEQA